MEMSGKESVGWIFSLMSLEDTFLAHNGSRNIHQTVAISLGYIRWGNMTEVSAELYSWSPSESSKGSNKASAGSPTEAVGVTVDIKNVSYSVFINGEERKLLQNISFHLDAGDMCALMGASGAGKRFG